MKKLLILTLALALACAAVACTGIAAPGSQPDPAPSSQPESVPESNASEPEPATPQPTVQEDKVTVADAAIYRGTVTTAASGTPKTDGSGGGLVLTLEQVAGTNFGAPALQFSIDGNTRISFPADQLGDGLVGRYLEIYYSPGVTKNPPDAELLYNAIGVNDLGQADMVITNGTIVEITPHPDKPGEGHLLVDPILPKSEQDGADGAPMQIAFLYNAESQFYLDFDSLKAGDKLNIFHSAAMTMSLPPQCFALEFRPYYDGTALQ